MVEMKNKVQVLGIAFKKTIPIMTGYLFLGMAFGLLINEAGYGWQWALLSSLFIYSGTAQFLSVSFMVAQVPLVQVVLLTFVLSFRHFFYGLSMITKYKCTGVRKPYLIHTLSDETYALIVSTEVPEGIDEKEFYFGVTLLDQMYWVIGSLIGATIGAIVAVDLQGIDFSMTALFAVLVVEQWKSQRNHIPALLGFVLTILAVMIFGPDDFLIPVLLLLSLLLVLFRNKMEV